MTLTEVGIEGALDAPDFQEQRSALAEGSIVVREFLNNPRPVGLIAAGDVADYLVSGEYGDREATLFAGLGKLVAKNYHSGDHKKHLKQDVTDYGDTVYSLIPSCKSLGSCTVKSLIRVDTAEGLFLVGHSHRLKSRGNVRSEQEIAPLVSKDINEFIVPVHRLKRLESLTHS